MASVKIVFWKHDQKKDGRFPLVVRITKDRKTRYVFTGEYIHEKAWDAKEHRVKKSHANSIRLNALLQKKLNDVHAAVLEAEASEDDLSTKQIQKKVKRKGNNVSFFELASERIKKQKHGRHLFSC